MTGGGETAVSLLLGPIFNGADARQVVRSAWRIHGKALPQAFSATQ
jgi:hypothetical protein